MNKVRVGIIGLGNMGLKHFNSIIGNKINGLEVSSVCDLNPSNMKNIDNNIIKFNDPNNLINSSKVDAVLLATPHFSHTELGIKIIKKGLHLMIEKPISVHVNDCKKLIETYNSRTNSEQKFGAMFNQRTDPRYIKIKKMITSGELGVIRRMNWIITTWFRTDHYYKSGGWRATWKGEGGGVLLNQCPHQLDLICWFFGKPKKIWASCRFGKWHNIEVEDDVTAMITYENGATCSFVTNTGESPGTNRLEIIGEKGIVVVDSSGIEFLKNEEEMSSFSKNSKQSFAKPSTKKFNYSFNDNGGQHVEILQNFTDSILKEANLIAPAVEGINSVELANGMLLSTFKNQSIDIPLDGDEYWHFLKTKIKSSSFDGDYSNDFKNNDFDKSF